MAAQWNLALVTLSRGDFARGWALYEARWRWSGWDFPQRDLPRPEWQGEPVQGRTVLVYCEQGLGDSMHFSRLVLPLVARGAKVIFEVQQGLLALMRHSLGEQVTVIPRETDPRQVHGDPDYDFHVSVLSLPYRLGLRLEDLPVATDYLRAPPADVQRWQARLPALPATKRVGMAWAGSPQMQRDASRSMALSWLVPLWDLPGIQWHSLQVGDAAEQALAAIDLPEHVLTWPGQLTPFENTAALVEHLDLVITVCTSVAHLAAAMGKPTWIMVANPAEWRWMQDRDDSPWYPSVRLFRQETPGDWAGVITRVKQALLDEGFTTAPPAR